MKNYQRLAHATAACYDCIQSGDTETQKKWESIIETVMGDSPDFMEFDLIDSLENYHQYQERDTQLFVLQFSGETLQNEQGDWTSWTFLVKPEILFGIEIVIVCDNEDDLDNNKQFLMEAIHPFLNHEEPGPMAYLFRWEE